jgi:hypothetical protein
MAQEENVSSNLFFNELCFKSKPTPETRAAWLANHLKLIDLGEKKKVREKAVTFFVRDDGSVRLPSGMITFGTVSGEGYRGLAFSMHRLVAEAFHLNPAPDLFDRVDHIDHIRTNNHYTNLRWVDHELNCANRKGCKNVRKRNSKWEGYYRVGGKRTTQCFDNEEEAIEWAQREKKKAWEELYQEKISQTRS